MKRIHMWKKSISLLLVLSLIMGVITIGNQVMASDRTSGVISDLKDYTRITMEDFGITASTEDGGTKYSEQKEGSYTGETLNKTYLDVDVNFHGGNGGSYFQYLHKTNWEQYLRVIHYGDGLSVYEGANTSNSIWMPELSNNGFFNLKLAVDMKANASDSSQSDITVKVWVDNVSKGELTLTGKPEELQKIYVVGSEASPISFRTPMVSAPEPEPTIPTLEEALEGYTEVAINDFEGLNATTAKEGATYTAEASGRYKGESLHHTYLNVDVNFHGEVQNYFHYLAEGNWDKYKRVSLSEDGVLLNDPLNPGAGSLWSLIEKDKFVNLKIRTDIVQNPNNTNQEDVTLQLWVNNVYVGENTWTEEIQNRNILFVYVASGSLSLRTPSEDEENPDPTEPKVDTVLNGYKKITTNDFAFTEDTFRHGWTEGNWVGYEYPESLHHTYFDVDLALCEDVNFGNTMRYLSADGWQSLQIGITDGELRVFETSTNTMIYKVPISDIGVRVDEFFNLKLSTDLEVNIADSSKTDMILSLWINDKLVRTTTGSEFGVIKSCSTVGSKIGIYLPYEGTIRIKGKESQGSTQDPMVTENPGEHLKKITFANFAISDNKYGYIGAELGAKGTYIFSVENTVFSGDFCFSKNGGADFRYGGNKNPWNGLRFWTAGDGKLYMQDATEKTERYEFHPMYAGTKLVDNMFNMKLAIEFVDSDNDGLKDDVKLGVWFNDVLYRNSYIYLADYAAQLGNACAVYVQAPDSWIHIASDKTIDTGVDFTLFGFTKNWKKELGMK